MRRLAKILCMICGIGDILVAILLMGCPNIVPSKGEYCLVLGLLGVAVFILSTTGDE